MSERQKSSYLRTPWGEEERRRKEQTRQAAADLDSKQNDAISNTVNSFLKQLKHHEDNKITDGWKGEEKNIDQKSHNHWVRKKNTSKLVAAYSQVENTNVSSAVEHTKTQLDRFQNNRFHDTGSDGDSSDEETPIDISKFGSISSAACHGAALISSIHGLWHTDFSREHKAKLAHITGYTTVELCRMFVDFNTLCSLSESPYGITWKVFRNALPLCSVEDPLFSGRVFEFMDNKERGLWRWEEYLLCMTIIFRSSRLLRSYFLFKIYDIDDDEQLSKDELFHFFAASLVVKVDSHLLEVSKTFVSTLFAEIDKDGDGEISLDETLSYILDHDEIEEVSSIFGRTIATNYTHGRWTAKTSKSMDAFHRRKYVEKDIAPRALFQKLRDDIEANTCADAQDRVERHLNDIKVQRGVDTCYKM